MKNDKGITTASVVVYVIVVTIVLSTLAAASTYLHKQIVKEEFKESGAKNFTSFISYFVENIQGEVGIAEDNPKNAQLTQIKFKDGTTYKYSEQNENIYKNNVKIAENVKKLSFIINENNPGQISIIVNFQAAGINKIITFYPRGK